MPALTELVIEDAGWADPALLHPFLPRTLRAVSLLGNPLRRLPRLALPELTQAQLSRCDLEAPPDITGLPALRSLHLADNHLTDVGALAGVPLDVLDLRGNRITDPTPLLATPPASLLLSGNPLTAEACAHLMERGLDSGRLYLYWQGVSIRLGTTPDPDAWRRHALPVGSHRYAVAYIGPIAATAAAAFARACGGDLAVPTTAELRDFLDRSTNRQDANSWG